MSRETKWMLGLTIACLLCVALALACADFSDAGLPYACEPSNCSAAAGLGCYNGSCAPLDGAHRPRVPVQWPSGGPSPNEAGTLVIKAGQRGDGGITPGP